MGSAKTFSTVLSALVILSSLSAKAEEVSAPLSLTAEQVTFGKKNSLKYELGAIESNVAVEPPTDSSAAVIDTSPDLAGFYASLSAALFGKDRSILEVRSGMTSLLEGENDFFWGGFKVWSSKPQFKDGAFSVSAGLPTVSMRAPIVGIPIGPVTLRVDAGVAAEAEITAKISPLISIPIQFTSIRGELTPTVSASGFVEGYAKWLILRAGIGGEVEFVRANTKISGQVGFGGVAPSFTLGDGFISTLAGKIYGFVDYMNIFSWKWKRALKPVIADWKGKCYSFVSVTEGGVDPCASAR